MVPGGPSGLMIFSPRKYISLLILMTLMLVPVSKMYEKRLCGSIAQISDWPVPLENVLTGKHDLIGVPIFFRASTWI